MSLMAKRMCFQGYMFLSFLTAVMSHQVEVIGNCSSEPDVTFDVFGKRHNLSCSLHNVKDCGSWFDEAIERTETSTASVSLSVEGVLVSGPHTDLIPQLVLSWHLPQSDELTGFVVEVQELTGREGSSNCYLYDLSLNNYTSTYTQLKFQRKQVGYQGGDDHLYRVNILRLPRKPEYVPASFNFKLQQPQKSGGRQTHTWTAAVSYTPVVHSGEITVSFSLAPEVYGFEQYSVQLVEHPPVRRSLMSCDLRPWNNYTCQGKTYRESPRNTTSISHTFYDVPQGSYRVWIQPHDHLRRNRSSCLCYQFQAVTDYHTERFCWLCATTHTGLINVVSREIPEANDTSLEREQAPITLSENRSGLSTSEMLALGLGSTIVMGIIVVMAAVLRMTKIAAKSNRVFLFYTEDNSYHSEVVHRFFTCLVKENIKVYSCSMHNAETRKADKENLSKHIDESDFILFITSEMFYRRVHTLFKLGEMDQIHDEEGVLDSAISYVVNKSKNPKVSKKLLQLQFDYVDVLFNLNDVFNVEMFRLPDQFQDLIDHIQGGFSKKRFHSNFVLGHSSEGCELIDAIVNARASTRDSHVKMSHQFDSGYALSLSSMHIDSVSMYYDGHQKQDTFGEHLSTVSYVTNRNHERVYPVYGEIQADSTVSFIPPSDITESLALEEIHERLALVNTL